MKKPIALFIITLLIASNFAVTGMVQAEPSTGDLGVTITGSDPIISAITNSAYGTPIGLALNKDPETYIQENKDYLFNAMRTKSFQELKDGFGEDPLAVFYLLSMSPNAGFVSELSTELSNFILRVKNEMTRENKINAYNLFFRPGSALPDLRPLVVDLLTSVTAEIEASQTISTSISREGIVTEQNGSSYLVSYYSPGSFTAVSDAFDKLIKKALNMNLPSIFFANNGAWEDKWMKVASQTSPDTREKILIGFFNNLVSGIGNIHNIYSAVSNSKDYGLFNGISQDTITSDLVTSLYNKYFHPDLHQASNSNRLYNTLLFFSEAFPGVKPSIPVNVGDVTKLKILMDLLSQSFSLLQGADVDVATLVKSLGLNEGITDSMLDSIIIPPVDPDRLYKISSFLKSAFPNYKPKFNTVYVTKDMVDGFGIWAGQRSTTTEAMSKVFDGLEIKHNEGSISIDYLKKVVDSLIDSPEMNIPLLRQAFIFYGRAFPDLFLNYFTTSPIPSKQEFIGDLAYYFDKKSSPIRYKLIDYLMTFFDTIPDDSGPAYMRTSDAINGALNSLLVLSDYPSEIVPRIIEYINILTTDYRVNDPYRTFKLKGSLESLSGLEGLLVDIAGVKGADSVLPHLLTVMKSADVDPIFADNYDGRKYDYKEEIARLIKLISGTDVSGSFVKEMEDFIKNPQNKNRPDIIEAAHKSVGDNIQRKTEVKKALEDVVQNNDELDIEVLDKSTEILGNIGDADTIPILDALKKSLDREPVGSDFKLLIPTAQDALNRLMGGGLKEEGKKVSLLPAGQCPGKTVVSTGIIDSITIARDYSIYPAAFYSKYTSSAPTNTVSYSGIYIQSVSGGGWTSHTCTKNNGIDYFVKGTVTEVCTGCTTKSSFISDDKCPYNNLYLLTEYGCKSVGDNSVQTQKTDVFCSCFNGVCTSKPGEPINTQTKTYPVTVAGSVVNIVEEEVVFPAGALPNEGEFYTATESDNTRFYTLYSYLLQYNGKQLAILNGNSITNMGYVITRQYLYNNKVYTDKISNFDSVKKLLETTPIPSTKQSTSCPLTPQRILDLVSSHINFFLGNGGSLVLGSNPSDADKSTETLALLDKLSRTGQQDKIKEMFKADPNKFLDPLKKAANELKKSGKDSPEMKKLFKNIQKCVNAGDLECLKNILSVEAPYPDTVDWNDAQNQLDKTALDLTVTSYMDMYQSQEEILEQWRTGNGQSITLPSGTVISAQQYDTLGFRSWFEKNKDNLPLWQRVNYETTFKEINARNQGFGEFISLQESFSPGNIASIGDALKRLDEDIAYVGARTIPLGAIFDPELRKILYDDNVPFTTRLSIMSGFIGMLNPYVIAAHGIARTFEISAGQISPEDRKILLDGNAPISDRLSIMAGEGGLFNPILFEASASAYLTEEATGQREFSWLGTALNSLPLAFRGSMAVITSRVNAKLKLSKINGADTKKVFEDLKKLGEDVEVTPVGKFVFNSPNAMSKFLRVTDDMPVAKTVKGVIKDVNGNVIAEIVDHINPFGTIVGGGDMTKIIRLKNGQILMMHFDNAGHGAEATKYSIVLRDILETRADLLAEGQLQQYLDIMNTEIERLNAGVAGGGEFFPAYTVSMIDPVTKNVQYSVGKNIQYAVGGSNTLYKISADGTLKELISRDANNIPIGKPLGQGRPVVATEKLEPGESVISICDGAIDACGGRKLQAKKLIEDAIKSNPSRPIPEIISNLPQEIRVKAVETAKKAIAKAERLPEDVVILLRDAQGLKPMTKAEINANYLESVREIDPLKITIAQFDDESLVFVNMAKTIVPLTRLQLVTKIQTLMQDMLVTVYPAKLSKLRSDLTQFIGEFHQRTIKDLVSTRLNLRASDVVTIENVGFRQPGEITAVNYKIKVNGQTVVPSSRTYNHGAKKIFLNVVGVGKTQQGEGLGSAIYDAEMNMYRDLGMDYSVTSQPKNPVTASLQVKNYLSVVVDANGDAIGNGRVGQLLRNKIPAGDGNFVARTKGYVFPERHYEEIINDMTSHGYTPEEIGLSFKRFGQAPELVLANIPSSVSAKIVESLKTLVPVSNYVLINDLNRMQTLLQQGDVANADILYKASTRYKVRQLFESFNSEADATLNKLASLPLNPERFSLAELVTQISVSDKPLEGVNSKVYVFYDGGIKKILKVNKIGAETAGFGDNAQVTLSRLENERDILTSLSSNTEVNGHIPKLYKSFTLADGRLALIEEYASGNLLNTLLEKGTMSVDELENVIFEAGQLKTKFQKNGLYYFDWHGGNIIVDNVGGVNKIKVIDFGESTVNVQRVNDQYAFTIGFQDAIVDFFKGKERVLLSQNKADEIPALINELSNRFGDNGIVIKIPNLRFILEKF